MLTYGDAVSDINVRELVKFHKRHEKIATLTAVNIGQRFGVLGIDGLNNVNSFREKGNGDGDRINAGYMVLEPSIFDWIQGDTTVFEKEPLEIASKNGELKAYLHNGFWQCMDTKREKDKLEELWSMGTAPWKIWKD